MKAELIEILEETKVKLAHLPVDKGLLPMVFNIMENIEYVKKELEYEYFGYDEEAAEQRLEDLRSYNKAVSDANPDLTKRDF